MGRVQILDGGSDSDSDQVAEIKINEEYARRYEHNKKREELHRLEEMKKRGDVADSESEDSESSSTEDEEEIIRESSKKKKLELVNALLKVKNQDPSLKNKHVKLFKSDETRKPRVKGDDDGKPKKKKFYLKDVNARHLMEQGPELEEEDDDVRSTDKEAKNTKVYDEDQEKLRKEFLVAVADDDEFEGELIIEKGKNAVDDDDDDDDDDVDDDEFDSKLNQCFPDEDENARFLKDYIKNEWWREDKCGTKVADDEDLSQDEMEIERQEEYEYRFQENAGDRILGHSRQVEGSVRKKDSARKKQRQSKEERMEIAKAEREEELRHLKNLKKKENSDKLKKIMEIAGIEDGEEASFDPKELDKEFDPQDYDRMMNKAFGQEYYEAEDADLDYPSDRDEDGGEIEKPNFDKEDELLGLPKGWDSVGSGDSFLAARDKALKLMESVGDHEEETEEEESEEESEEEEDGKEGKQEKKRKFALLDRAKKEMMDEYYKLDYEDTIEDLKTRFKYAKIKPNRFGLTTSEILVLDEKELNQYVSLKKLAPYAEKEWKAPNNKKMEMKEKFKEIAVGLRKKGKPKKNQKKQRISVDAKPSSSSTHPAGQSSMNAPENGKEQAGGSNGDTAKKSRGSRWRKKQAAQKLSPTRLKAYGVS